MRNTLNQAANTEKPARKLEKEWATHGRINRIAPCVGSQGRIMDFFGSGCENSVRLNVLKQFISYGIKCSTSFYL